MTYAQLDLELVFPQGGVSVAPVVPDETCGDENEGDCSDGGDGVFARCLVVVTAVQSCFPKDAAAPVLGNHQFRDSHLFLAAIPLRLLSAN